MPPRRTIGSSSRSLYGEPEPPVYFPPVGRGENGFGSYVSPAYADRAAMDDLEAGAKRDEILTRRADNILRRASSASQFSLIPYQERASRARLDFEPERIGSERRLLPSSESARMAQNQYQTALDEAQLQDLPDMLADRASQRDARLEAIQNRDRYSEALQRDHAANKDQAVATYQQFQSIAPPELRGAKRNEWADQQTRGLLKQREAVDAANFLANEVDYNTGKPYDPTALDFIETVSDAEGLPIGHRIKKGADPKRVADSILSYRRHQNDRQQREKRLQTDSAYYNQDIDNTTALLRIDEGRAESLRKIGKIKEADEVDSRISQHRQRIQTLSDELRKLRRLPPLGSAQTPALPATTSEPKADSTIAPKGRATNVADFYKGLK